LILAGAIRRIAREEKLAAGLVEKDYALSWLLRGFYLGDQGLGDSIVLKGGTVVATNSWKINQKFLTYHGL